MFPSQKIQSSLLMVFRILIRNDKAKLCCVCVCYLTTNIHSVLEAFLLLGLIYGVNLNLANDNHSVFVYLRRQPFPRRG